MKKGLYILFLGLLPLLGIGQGRVFINSGYIVLGISGTASHADPTYFIVHNPSPDAITQTSGGIVTEKEWGMLWWDIGAPSVATNYSVPFSYYAAATGTSLPLTVSIAGGSGGTASGAGTGTLLFSTWHGTTPNCFSGGGDIADNQCYMPSDVTNMYPGTTISSPSSTNDSYYAADRFWVIDANTGYSTKPSPQITFSYMNSGIAGSSEVSSPNVFTEADLIPQRFNSTLLTWGDWTLNNQSVSDAATVGTLTMGAAVPASGFFRSWVLASSQAPLPIVLTSFTATCDSNHALLQWTSATESNNDHYTLEKSTDGINFNTIAIVKGAGTTSSPLNYSYTDNTPSSGTSYYKLSQTDLDGTTTALMIIPFTECVTPVNTIEAYNANGVVMVNINAIEASTYTITLLDVLGQPILSETRSVSIGDNTIRLHPNVSDGIYILNAKSNEVNYNKKLFIGR